MKIIVFSLLIITTFALNPLHTYAKRQVPEHLQLHN